jgi:hypothetical protein
MLKYEALRLLTNVVSDFLISKIQHPSVLFVLVAGIEKY